MNSEDMAPETKQVRAAVQATIYALLDYLDPGGFGGGFVCPVSAGRRNHMQPSEPPAYRWPRHKIGVGNPHKYYLKPLRFEPTEDIRQTP